MAALFGSLLLAALLADGSLGQLALRPRASRLGSRSSCGLPIHGVSFLGTLAHRLATPSRLASGVFLANRTAGTSGDCSLLGFLKLLGIVDHHVFGVGLVRSLVDDIVRSRQLLSLGIDDVVLLRLRKVAGCEILPSRRQLALDGRIVSVTEVSLLVGHAVPSGPA